jgi:hypothetical protein
MKIWILDENCAHVATVDGAENDVLEFVRIEYPHGIFDPYMIDEIGPECANARFERNPKAKEIKI